MARKLRYRLEYVAVLLLLPFTRLLGARQAVAVGRLVGDLAFALSRERRTIALSNLAIAFPEKGEAERKSIARKSFHHFGRLLIEGLRFPLLNPLKYHNRWVTYEGRDVISQITRENQGYLLISAHFGNWELIAICQGFLGHPLDIVTRELDNPYLEDLLARFRRMSGNRIIHRDKAAKQILRALGEGRGVGLVIDQNVRGQHAVLVHFFGHLASTTPAAARFALKTGAPIVPVFSIPNEDGSYHVVYEPPLTFQPSGNHDEDITQLTQECTDIIQRYVSRYPEHWLWMHRRWGTVAPPHMDATPTGVV